MLFDVILQVATNLLVIATHLTLFSFSSLAGNIFQLLLHTSQLLLLFRQNTLLVVKLCLHLLDMKPTQQGQIIQREIKGCLDDAVHQQGVARQNFKGIFCLEIELNNSLILQLEEILNDDPAPFFTLDQVHQQRAPFRIYRQFR